MLMFVFVGEPSACEREARTADGDGGRPCFVLPRILLSLAVLILITIDRCHPSFVFGFGLDR